MGRRKSITGFAGVVALPPVLICSVGQRRNSLEAIAVADFGCRLRPMQKSQRDTSRSLADVD
jgi:hypothetical protein